jgi:hypothetical protein
MRTRTLLVCLSCFRLFAQSAQIPPQKEPTAEISKSQVNQEDRKGQPLPKPSQGTPTTTPKNDFSRADANSNGKNHDNESQKSADPDWWMIGLTFGLVLVGAGQVWILAQQTHIINEGLSETRKATELTRKSSEAAVESNTLTRESNEITRQATELTRQNIEIAKTATELTRQSIVLTHRPKLIVRNVVLDHESEIVNFGATRGWPIPANGTLRIVNIGSSMGSVVSRRCVVLALNTLPMGAPRDLPEDETRIVDLPSGKYGTMPFPTDDREPLSVEELMEIRAGRLGIYVMGHIGYKDDLGNIRATWFCREWRSGYPSFRPVDNPDYENAD